MIRRWLNAFLDRLLCDHQWNIAHAMHYWGEGWLVSEYCTKCGANRWRMEP